MRKIEREMVAAIKDGKNWQKDNTRVDVQGDSVVVSLWGNEIARKTGSILRLSSCGWRTTTTKSRLNAVLQACGFHGGIFQTKRVWRLYQNPAAMAGRSVCPSMPFDDGMIVILDGGFHFSA